MPTTSPISTDCCVIVSRQHREEAVRRFEAGLKRITAAAGHPEKHHATITNAFAFLVGERITEQGPLSWDDFEIANPDLFDWPNSALLRMYPDDALHTSVARKTFVMPFGRESSTT